MLVRLESILGVLTSEGDHYQQALSVQDGSPEW